MNDRQEAKMLAKDPDCLKNIPFPIGHDASAKTKECRARGGYVNGQPYVVIDSPGFGDTNFDFKDYEVRTPMFSASEYSRLPSPPPHMGSFGILTESGTFLTQVAIKVSQTLGFLKQVRSIADLPPGEWATARLRSLLPFRRPQLTESFGGTQHGPTHS